MALFSFRHSVKTFSDKRTVEGRSAQRGQTAAHLRYITRPKAAREVLRERMTKPSYAAAAQEAEDAAQKRKGRVCERFIIALPIEATYEQRASLAKAFAEKLTGGVAGYVAAIHDQHGNDRSNPHFHLVAFDVMIKSGGRGRPKSTLGMARKNAIETTAKMWADTHNDLMRKWGYDSTSMVSHLSLQDRGIDRVPTIHEGPAARAIEAVGKQPKRKERWRHVDEGYSRAEANKIIREINKTKEQVDEREYRLGRHDEENGAERDQCFFESRKGRGSDGTGAGNTAPAFATTGSNKEKYGGDRKPSKRPSFAPYPARRQRPGRTENQFPLSRLGRRRRAGRRYGVRRIFRELIWLRDTLQARLLPNEGQSRSHIETTDQQPASVCKKSRRSVRSPEHLE
ncbi:MobA/MobL family protein [Sulfitobacter litoralis]|uniref:MobA/MobL family protein n=1 Tax=Sulfitobacter litoralis TaxID=335975 RepID=UPI0030EE9878|tara:strand:+ start:4383 stop:5576 length:1194 start_codon:yes stop_codon:yes gene_type:complete